MTPYIWLPTINGTLRFALSQAASPVPIPANISKTIDGQIKPGSYLSDVNFSLAGNAVIRRGNLALYADFFNVNTSAVKSSVAAVSAPGSSLAVPVTGQAEGQIVSTLCTIGPSYTVYHAHGASVDLLVGGQFLPVSGNANVR